MILITGRRAPQVPQVLKEQGFEVEIRDGATPEHASSGPQGIESKGDAEVVVIEGDASTLQRVLSASREVTPRSSRALRVAFTYNVKRGIAGDQEAEFDSPRTISAIVEALQGWGYEVVPIEAGPDLPARLDEVAPDLVFNIAEGWHGRSRESQVPAMLEYRGIPFVGSDSVSIALTLDKVLAKRLVASAGLDTPAFQVFRAADEPLNPALSFPLIVKPACEGSSKGIGEGAVVHDEEALRARVRHLRERYNQPALVEAYISGREFTVAVIGNGAEPCVLPVLEVAFNEAAGEFPVYSYEIKQEIVAGARYLCPAPIDRELAERLARRAREVFAALELRDLARVDFRLADDGTIHFLEVNPLPGLTPDYSDVCLIASAAGLTYQTLVGHLMRAALTRMGFPEEAMPGVVPLTTLAAGVGLGEVVG
ncbi:ATP-grasp domain-containing protein [Lujinxingia vulgaris]|uniref:ATP-grasp domain-containing protein n=1 Tax=Lujinxingia vulgaris TaxID=2600176 RepID=A0A5C6WWZ7_9DELT|nr:ATP-grasp domain-containing protein [Lujinxingia vulgaris]TXD31388.1 ATP-grasp domain-containing protein [Lujinxingia vulgaris]